jgi:hypothetical protein
MPSSGQWIGKIIRKGIDKWLGKDERCRIRIAWIPAHTGIRGNEEADKLVKVACSKLSKVKGFYLPFILIHYNMCLHSLWSHFLYTS